MKPKAQRKAERLTDLCECGHWRMMHKWWCGCLVYLTCRLCPCLFFVKAKAPHVMTQAECRQGPDAPEKYRCPYLQPDGKCETFTCSRCGRIYPWCQGSDDDQPEWCDDCHSKGTRPC